MSIASYLSVVQVCRRSKEIELQVLLDTLLVCRWCRCTRELEI